MLRDSTMMTLTFSVVGWNRSHLIRRPQGVHTWSRRSRAEAGKILRKDGFKVRQVSSKSPGVSREQGARHFIWKWKELLLAGCGFIAYHHY